MFNVYIGFAQPDEWESMAAGYARHARRFEAAAGGVPCFVLPFNHVTPALMERLQPRKVVLSGFARSFEQYDVPAFYGVADWLRETRLPTLALCGSHQLLGFVFNQDLRQTDRLCDEPMRRLRPGEPIINPDFHPDFFMEIGFYQLTLTEAGRADPLFAGIGLENRFFESHYCEIKRLPPGFELLASTPECYIQAIRHQQRPMYGLQLHPEGYTERFPDGKRLLENFFALPESA